MVNPYRHDAKKSHIDKLSRMCGGGHASKKAHGGSAKPAIAFSPIADAKEFSEA